jgi:predicted small integral membrane protein
MSKRLYPDFCDPGEVQLLAVRIAKITCTATLAFYVALVAFNNLTDYGTNFAFVTQVLDMDYLLPASHLRWRAIPSPVLHHVSYILRQSRNPHRCGVSVFCGFFALTPWQTPHPARL